MSHYLRPKVRIRSQEFEGVRSPDVLALLLPDAFRLRDTGAGFARKGFVFGGENNLFFYNCSAGLNRVLGVRTLGKVGTSLNRMGNPLV